MLSISCKSTKFIRAIHVDIPERDSSSMTRRNILEQEIFPVAGNISRDRKYFLGQGPSPVQSIGGDGDS